MAFGVAGPTFNEVNVKLIAPLLIGFLLIPGLAQPHEFWVEPDKFMAAVGNQVTLDLRVGQMLNGVSYPFFSRKFVRYVNTVSGETLPFDGREGDTPSLTFTADREGLNVISYHAIPEFLTYDTFSDFVEFVEDEGLAQIVDQHKERGLPSVGFTEGYSRNSKALVQIGPVKEGQNDEFTGMPYELIAMANPYAGQDTLQVKLLWQGDPVPDAQVAIFYRSADGVVSRSLTRTEDTGVATIPTANAGFYMLSSVWLDEREAESGEVWHSTWAALSFGVTR